eukprot:TRINITY_DN1221_c0_g1_i4.p1 TRINITY_DN1221_c0_g1~~TRINITY_DN1221_c0_g1_i4.p1  ORF type:complete len:104 (-),score=23.65 TRINITY_DN1221_c0_g1_i4:203-514(-)
MFRMMCIFFFFLMIRRPPRSTLSSSSAASDVYKRQVSTQSTGLAGLNLLEGADEVETKLDLARAYMDMDDLDGAKDILQEIVSEGNEQQKAEAEALITSINEK